jgi:hypothetical protein
MKKLLFVFLILNVLTPWIQATELWEASYGKLLKKYVYHDGVDYQLWKNNPQDMEELNKLVESLALKTTVTREPHTRLAYLINTYNILVLKGVLDMYPVKSVRDIAPEFGFFHEKRFIFEGTPVSLNHVEKDLLLKTFKDPHIHFAVNCASISCPPLLNEPYTASKVMIQLESVTRTFLEQNPEAVRLEKNRYLLSSLFSWYAADFATQGSALNFINRYRKQPLPPNAKIEYLDYNWNLNQSSVRK